MLNILTWLQWLNHQQPELSFDVDESPEDEDDDQEDGPPEQAVQAN